MQPWCTRAHLIWWRDAKRVLVDHAAHRALNLRNELLDDGVDRALEAPHAHADHVDGLLVGIHTLRRYVWQAQRVGPHTGREGGGPSPYKSRSSGGMGSPSPSTQTSSAAVARGGCTRVEMVLVKDRGCCCCVHSCDACAVCRQDTSVLTGVGCRHCRCGACVTNAVRWQGGVRCWSAFMVT